MQLVHQISLTEAETIFVSLGPVPEERFEHQNRGLWFEWEAGAEVRALRDGSSQCCSFGCWRARRYQDTCWPFLPLRFPFFFLPHLNSSSVPWACAPSLLCRLTLIHEYPPARLASPFLSYTLQVPCRLTGLMLASELPTDAFLGSTGEGKGWGEKLAPSLSFLTEQARNWAVKFGEPLFPVHCARFWTQTWMKFHWWLFFPAHLGTIWGQYNGIHHGFVSTAAPWTCSHPFY